MPVTRRTKEKILEEFNRNVREINRNLQELEEKTPDSIALERYKGEFFEINDPNYNYNALRRMNKRAKQLLESGAVSVEGQERSMSLALDMTTSTGETSTASCASWMMPEQRVSALCILQHS